MGRRWGETSEDIQGVTAQDESIPARGTLMMTMCAVQYIAAEKGFGGGGLGPHPR
jgi:hypothetical protein